MYFYRQKYKVLNKQRMDEKLQSYFLKTQSKSKQCMTKTCGPAIKTINSQDEGEFLPDDCVFEMQSFIT